MGLSAFDARGPRIVVAGNKTVVLSTDGGKSFRAVDLPPKSGRINTVHIAASGPA